jgi:hypothetical protein
MEFYKLLSSTGVQISRRRMWTLPHHPAGQEWYCSFALSHWRHRSDNAGLGHDAFVRQRTSSPGSGNGRYQESQGIHLLPCRTVS